ncbi:MAG: ACT domain-containing protein [Syntrophaceae bacterium]|nr:ACT domain-containing protein [Syntrophaceae bacterium]
MKVEQISIFLENKPGGLENVTRILRDANINIRTLAVADTSDFGIVRLIVDHVDDAVRVLKENGYTVSRTNVVAVEVPDQPGGLHSILEVLAQAKINIEYMYAFVERSGENAVMLFRFDNPDTAIDVLLKNQKTVLHGEKLYSL